MDLCIKLWYEKGAGSLERTPKERLYWLLELYKKNEISISIFCDEFHQTYDHDLIEELTDEEAKLFRDLSHCAARFSDGKEDVKLYPNVYTSAETINAK
jgi:hypothetical protein